MLLDNLWNASVRTRVFLRRRMPTNILLDKIRTRGGLKWGVPAVLLGAAYLGAAYLGAAYLGAAVGCVLLIEHGWPEPFYLLFFLILWNSLKFLLMGPITVILLIYALTREILARRRVRRWAVAE